MDKTFTSQAGSPEVKSAAKPAVALWVYMLVGFFFGVILIKSEAASWFRIQEMFRFQSLHMYGLMGSAVLTGFISLRLLRALGVKTLDGEPFKLTPKAMTPRRYIFGGLLFGLGWGLAGVCPGPMFALIGAGILPMVVVLLFALVGTWLYGVLKDKLPH